MYVVVVGACNNVSNSPLHIVGTIRLKRGVECDKIEQLLVVESCKRAVHHHMFSQRNTRSSFL